jgi:hypothetical protein
MQPIILSTGGLAMPQALLIDKQTQKQNPKQRRPKLAHPNNNHNIKERQQYIWVRRKEVMYW